MLKHEAAAAAAAAAVVSVCVFSRALLALPMAVRKWSFVSCKGQLVHWDWRRSAYQTDPWGMRCCPPPHRAPTVLYTY